MLAARLVEPIEAVGKKFFFYFLWIVIFYNAIGRLKKGLACVKVIEGYQHDA